MVLPTGVGPRIVFGALVDFAALRSVSLFFARQHRPPNGMPDIYSNWPRVVDTYLAHEDPGEPVATILRQFRNDPLSVDKAIDPEIAEQYKPHFVEFVLDGVRTTLQDHALSAGEVHVVRHVCRVLRIREGELHEHRHELVIRILARELELLLADDHIDPNEALHKVKVQEVLGLSYDEFVDFTRDKVEQVLLRLLERFDESIKPDQLPDRIHWFRNVTTALDTVYNLNPVITGAGKAGHVYLLINTAMPGMLKVGKTTRPPETRVMELSGATGVPVPFELLFYVAVSDAHAAERFVHTKLEELGARVSDNREFFSAPPKTAVDLMLRARDKFPVESSILTADAESNIVSG